MAVVVAVEYAEVGRVLAAPLPLLPPPTPPPAVFWEGIHVETSETETESAVEEERRVVDLAPLSEVPATLFSSLLVVCAAVFVCA